MHFLTNQKTLSHFYQYAIFTLRIFESSVKQKIYVLKVLQIKCGYLAPLWDNPIKTRFSVAGFQSRRPFERITQFFYNDMFWDSVETYCISLPWTTITSTRTLKMNGGRLKTVTHLNFFVNSRSYMINFCHLKLFGNV